MANRVQVTAFEKPEVERVLVAQRVGDVRVVGGEGFKDWRHPRVAFELSVEMKLNDSSDPSDRISEA
jgi:hypothetical protein